MSSISGLAAQANSIGGCASPPNCCGEVSSLSSKVAQLTTRLAALESKPQKDHSADIGKIFALLGTLQIGLTAYGGLAAEVAALSATVATLAAGAAALGAEIALIGGTVAAVAAEVAAATLAIAPLILGVAAIAGIAFIANQALSQSKATSLIPGVAGPRGLTGERGLTGYTGERGASGERGLQGFAGAQGLQGAAGLSGIAGSPGAKGAMGLTGATGAQGLTGERGLTGARGDRGFVGAIGVGSQGIPGIQGLQGAAGLSGIAGSPGAKGVAGAPGAPGSPGIAGSSGAKGVAGAPGAPGSPGIAGSPGAKGVAGAPGAPGATGATGAKGADGINSISSGNTVNPGKEQEIIDLLKDTRADVIAIPAVLVGSQLFRAAAVSAAAAGACQSSRPGSCPGGSADQTNALGNKLNAISAAAGVVNNEGLKLIMGSLNTINLKLGNQIVGGLSAWSKGIAEVVNKSQILNVLTYISVLHNAYMLSNALSQTLFSAVGNSLAALGLKDTSVDPAGTPFNVGKIVGDWTETFFKSVFGVATVNGIKADWKKYSRIYQAAANVLYSVQSIGHSVLGGLEVVGSHVGKIGNALQKFRLVGEKAYSWMNPTPSFQNRFLTGLQFLTEAVSQVDQVASGVLSVQDNVSQFSKNKEELDKSMGQEEGSKQAPPIPEAVKVKEAADAAKIASASPVIPESSIPKP